MAWIDPLFQRMAQLRASDLHLTSGLKPIFRIDGDMTAVEEVPIIKPSQMEQILAEFTPPRNLEEFREKSDTDFAYDLAEYGRFRVNLFRDHRGPGAVFRLIPSHINTIEELGLPSTVLDFCQLSKGLVVVTGPTGSGKSTTLAAMIDYINRSRSDHIITIEDPIEFVHPQKSCLINQREVGVHTADFKSALRAALREDPDIVLVGEMRDLETIEIALETAETGHLVFGTLHTTTAASTIDRIIDQFPADEQPQIRTMLSTSLRGVVAQTLCKRKPSGRVAAVEILVVNSAVSSQIREGKTHQIINSMQMGGKLGMRMLNSSLLELVKSGTIEPDEAFAKAVDKAGMQRVLGELGFSTASASASPLEAAAASETPAPLPPTASASAQTSVPPAAAPGPAGSPTGAAGAGAPGYADPFENFKRARG